MQNFMKTEYHSSVENQDNLSNAVYTERDNDISNLSGITKTSTQNSIDSKEKTLLNSNCNNMSTNGSSSCRKKLDFDSLTRENVENLNSTSNPNGFFINNQINDKIRKTKKSTAIVAGTVQSIAQNVINKNTNEISSSANSETNPHNYNINKNQYSKIPSNSKRNARERKRVRTINDYFSQLQKYLPHSKTNNNGQIVSTSKKLSKVETLKAAIEYIELLLTFSPYPYSQTTKASTSNKSNTHLNMLTPCSSSSPVNSMSSSPSSILSSPASSISSSSSVASTTSLINPSCLTSTSLVEKLINNNRSSKLNLSNASSGSSQTLVPTSTSSNASISHHYSKSLNSNFNNNSNNLLKNLKTTETTSTTPTQITILANSTNISFKSNLTTVPQSEITSSTLSISSTPEFESSNNLANSIFNQHHHHYLQHNQSHLNNDNYQATSTTDIGAGSMYNAVQKESNAFTNNSPGLNVNSAILNPIDFNINYNNNYNTNIEDASTIYNKDTYYNQQYSQNYSQNYNQIITSDRMIVDMPYASNRLTSNLIEQNQQHQPCISSSANSYNNFNICQIGSELYYN